MKVHHDNHGSNASVPAKGNKRIPSEQHWEKSYKQYECSPNMYKTGGSDFDAKQSDKRKTTHLKVNREDH